MNPSISMLIEAENIYRREHVTDEFRRSGARDPHGSRSRGHGRRWRWRHAGAA